MDALLMHLIYVVGHYLMHAQGTRETLIRNYSQLEWK